MSTWSGLDLIKESHEHVKQMQLRTREDEKETAIERERGDDNSVRSG